MRPIGIPAGLLAPLALLATAASAQDQAAGGLTLPTTPASVLAASGFLPEDFADLDCPGRITVVRFNRAKEGATLRQFEDAVSAHKAWLASKGYGDVEISILTGGPLTSADDFLFGTAIVYPSQARAEAIFDNRDADQDAAYEAFTALYAASTDGYDGYGACVSAPGELR